MRDYPTFNFFEKSLLEVEVPQWHREVLRQRVTVYQAHPVEGTPWPEV
ncbi:MAG: addiction module protein, partial [Gammaproteobacteria bacterium]